MDVKTVIQGFNEEQLEEIVNRDTNVLTMNACLFSLKPYQWYVRTWGKKKYLQMYKYRYRGWDDQGVI